MRKKPNSSPSPALSPSMDTSEDPDTEEALKGFDFLSSPDEMDTSPESRGSGDNTDWGESLAHPGYRAMGTLTKEQLLSVAVVLVCAVALRRGTILYLYQM